jgi:hypothetical protein
MFKPDKGKGADHEQAPAGVVTLLASGVSARIANYQAALMILAGTGGRPSAAD